MGTLIEKVQRALDTKNKFKTKLTEKGVTISDDLIFYNYPNKLDEITTGGGGGIPGVVYEDSELFVDCEVLRPNEVSINNTVSGADVYIDGDTTTVILELLDGTVDITNCTSYIYIVDNGTNKHTVDIENLSPGNIKDGVTILGVTGNYMGGAGSSDYALSKNLWGHKVIFLVGYKTTENEYGTTVQLK